VTAPLEELVVLDLTQNSPGPLATMLLGDFGATVIHVCRPGFTGFAQSYGGDIGDDPYITLRYSAHDAMMRNKRSLALDFKAEAGRAAFLRLVEQADVLVEEMRPGKMAKLGLGYGDLAPVNPRLIYCSVTGYGQTGPMRDAGGHDINYLAMAGALEMFRRGDDDPVNPQTILSDNGGGTMSAFAGILLALLAREKTGRGQHVDVALTDSVMTLMTDLYSTAIGGGAPSESFRGTHMGDLPHYGVYRCADGKWVAVGAFEQAFSEAFLDGLGRPDLGAWLDDFARWPALRTELEAIFATAPRDVWVERFAGLDAAVTPVLSPEEAATHPQAAARGMVGEAHGVRQVGVSPKLSETLGAIHRPPAEPGAHSETILADFGFTPNEIAALRHDAAIT